MNIIITIIVVVIIVVIIKLEGWRYDLFRSH
jgi:hypothetical protein